jgi:Uma2 family endonuclease
MRMGYPALDLDGRFSYGQYKTWPDEERWELIDGVAYDMSPAPNYNHQEIAGWLYASIRSWLKERRGPCRVYIAPADVLLPRGDEADDEIDCVVQPDVFVVCDPKKVGLAFARGAPDFVVEILSPRTSRKDQNEKLRLYERSGVREYWTIDPAGRWLRAYSLGEKGYGEGELFESEGRLASSVLRDEDGLAFAIETEELFAQSTH